MALPARLIHYYFQQTWPEVQDAFAILDKVRVGLQKGGAKIENTLYEFVGPINSRIVNHLAADPFWEVDKQTIRLIDLELVDQYNLNPLNKDLTDTLAQHLFNIYSALGFLPTAEPYTPSELKSIITGEGGDIYNISLLLFTMRKVLEGWFTADMIPIIAALVLAEPVPAQNSRVPLKGEQALLYNLMLQLLWRWFAFLPPMGQASLLKHFLHQSVVSEINVRARIKQYLNLPGVDAAKQSRIFADYAAKSNELVPSKTTGEEWKTLEELMNGFYSRATGRPESGFVQEQYAREVYNGQENRDFFSSWLREVISIIVHLRSGDLQSS